MATSAAAHLPSAAAPAADHRPPVSPLDLALLLLRFSTVMALLLGIAALPTSSLFPVHTVRVSGALRIPPGELLALTGLRSGDRLFAVPVQDVASRVARHPGVAGATARIDTSGDVVIQIVERTAYAAFPFQGRYLILDRSGIVFEERPSADGLPVLTATGFLPDWTRLGDRLPSGGVDRALMALQRLPEGVVTPGTRLRAEPEGDITLFTPDGIAVRLGPLHGLEERAALMREVLDAARGRGLALEYVDLRFSGNVVMKPAAPREGAGEGAGR